MPQPLAQLLHAAFPNADDPSSTSSSNPFTPSVPHAQIHRLLMTREKNRRVDPERFDDEEEDEEGLKSNSGKGKGKWRYETWEAKREGNEKKNRYIDIHPYSTTLVRLSPLPTSLAQSQSQPPPPHPDRDYINASWVVEPELFTPTPSSQIVGDARWWVATQGPLPVTLHSFYRLFLSSPLPPSTLTSSPSHHSAFPSSTLPKTLVQLTGLVESGRVKCARYVPKEVGDNVLVREPSSPSSPSSPLVIRVRLIEKEDEAGGAWIRSKIGVKWLRATRTRNNTNGGPQSPPPQPKSRLPRGPPQDIWDLEDLSENDEMETEIFGGGSREIFEDEQHLGTEKVINHFEFLDWRDHDVPEDESSILRFLERVYEVNDSSSTTKSRPPIVVHCSAGVGRTGTLISISSLFRYIPFISSSVSDSTPRSKSPSPGLPPIDLSRLVPSHLQPFRGLPPIGTDPRESKVKEDLVAQTVDMIREQRTTMVQTFEQLFFVYKSLETALDERSSR